MAPRKPQINFQVDEAMKMLYDEAKICGHFVTRFCAAGLLLMVEDPQQRVRALERLREWDEEYSDASAKEIRAFVLGAQGALRGGARGTRRGRPTRPARKTARRGRGG